MVLKVLPLLKVGDLSEVRIFSDLCLGFLKLLEDDIVFIQAMDSPASGEQDVPVCWVTGRCVLHYLFNSEY